MPSEEEKYFSHHRYQLAAAVMVILAAFFLSPVPPGGECVSFLGYDLPPVCPHRVLFHNICPGCGLIRSFVALAHGQFNASFHFHRIGPFFFLAVLLQIPLRCFMLWRGPQPLSSRLDRTLSLPGKLLIFALIMNWLLSFFHIL